MYLYSQARRKAEQVLTGAANTLEGHIAALSSEMELQKGSFKKELDDLKGSVLKAQNEENYALKGSIEAQLLRSMSALKCVLDAQEEEITALKGALAALKGDTLAQKAAIVTQQGDLSALKGEMGAQKFTLQGDIVKILAWLGRNPYLPNPATAAATTTAHALRQQPHHRVPTSHLLQQRDIYEAAMRKQFEIAGL